MGKESTLVVGRTGDDGISIKQDDVVITLTRKQARTLADAIQIIIRGKKSIG